MYLRHTTVRGKRGPQTYWTLVRSVRHGSKVRQEVVAHLGRLDSEAKRQASALARHFLGPRAGQPELYEDTRELSPAQVHVGRVRVERGRAFGDVWLAWTLWKVLGLFDLGCSSSGQVLSYTKMLGQLQDAGNTTTLAHYLDLLSAAGLLTGLSKFAGSAVRQRGSSPKLQVFDTALQTATSGSTPAELSARPELRGHLIESLVGAHLVNAAARGVCKVHGWRDRNREVDFVVRRGATLLALEVQSGRPRSTLPGLATFLERWPEARPLLIGGDGLGLEDFLNKPVEDWLGV